MKISEAMSVAVEQLRAGRLEAAAEICRRVLEVQPDHLPAHELAGAIAYRLGDYDGAAGHFRCALARDAEAARHYGNLGMALRAQGKSAEAIDTYEQGLRRAPAMAELHNNLGNAWRDARDLARAVACFEEALRLKGDYVEAHQNLGETLAAQGRREAAAACWRRAIALKPDFVPALNSLGNLLRLEGRPAEALGAFQQALGAEPDNADVHNNLGNALNDLGRLDEAVTHYSRAIELRPDLAEAHANLGRAQADAGEIEAALASYRRSMELRPDSARRHSDFVYQLHFSPEASAEDLCRAAREWNDRHAARVRRLAERHPNDPTPDRRLRVGYVSADLREHPVGRFAWPLLEAHDRQGFEVFCYASVVAPDAITDRCRRAADQWRDVRELSDERLADLIFGDRIDVLVDLTLHAAGSRLMAFARKPAPVQVSYLSYCSTTGLAAMDYRLTDPYLDRPGEAQCYAEQSVWLPETYWCYQPMDEAGEVGRRPAGEAGAITFGCLNNFSKANPAALAAWARVLQRVPGSRLVLFAREGRHRQRVRDVFAGQGVSPERVGFTGFLPAERYFELYRQIDVALDAFPFAGGTTTCDALWMGVPVVSLVGRTAVGRAGVSILSNVGLPELVAVDVDRYVEIAVELAADAGRLAELRGALRRRMGESALMDVRRFAGHVEAAYRSIWQRWCLDRPASKPAQ